MIIVNQEENKQVVSNQEIDYEPHQHSEEGSEHDIIERKIENTLPPIHQHREKLNTGELDQQVDNNVDIRTVSEIPNQNGENKVFDEEE